MKEGNGLPPFRLSTETGKKGRRRILKADGLSSFSTARTIPRVNQRSEGLCGQDARIRSTALRSGRNQPRFARRATEFAEKLGFPSPF